MFKKKSPLKSSNLVRRKRRMMAARIILGVLLACLFIASVTRLFHLKAFTITDIVIEGNSAVDSKDLENIVRSDIAGAYAYIFPKSNKLIYPKKKIIADIVASEKRVLSADVKTSGTTLTLAITEREPSYVWCAGEPLGRGEKGCYLIDSRGYIFDEAPTFSGNAYFAFYGGGVAAAPVGSHFLDPENFKRLVSFVRSLESLGLHSSSLLAKNDAVRELHLSKGGKLIFKNAADYTGLYSSIEAVYTTTDIFTKRAASLEYADFRFGNKIYYKFVGDNSGQL